MSLYAWERQQLTDAANCTKRGSVARQTYIGREVENLSELLTRADVRSAADFRLFVQTWITPALDNVRRAADGREVRS